MDCFKSGLELYARDWINEVLVCLQQRVPIWFAVPVASPAPPLPAAVPRLYISCRCVSRPLFLTLCVTNRTEGTTTVTSWGPAWPS